MKHKIRKLIPVDMMQIPALESWLSDLAEEGLFLVSFGSAFAKFEQREPQKLPYRIEPFLVSEASDLIQTIRSTAASTRGEPHPLTPEEKQEQMIALYEECGWEYICKINQFFGVFRGKEEDAPEIHTDPVAQSLAYETLYRRQKKSLLRTLPFAVILLAFCLYQTFWGENFYISMKSNMILLPQLILLLLSFWLFLRQTRKYRQIRDHLKEGIPMEHRVDWHSGKLFRFLKTFAIDTLVLIYIWYTVLGFSADWEGELNTLHRPLPYLALEEIETSPAFAIDRSNLYEGKDHENYATFNTSLLIPAQYEIEQQGIVPDRRWADNSGIYSPSLEMRYYDLRFAFLTKPFFDSMLEWFIYNESGYTDIFDDRIDEGILYDNEGSQHLFLRKDDHVLAVFYYGEEDLGTHFDALFALLEKSYPTE